MLDMIRNSISQTPEAAALFYDELARIIQIGGIDPKIEVHFRKYTVQGRHGSLMVSVPDSRSSGPGSSPGQGHCVVFLGKTLYSHSVGV